MLLLAPSSTRDLNQRRRSSNDRTHCSRRPLLVMLVRSPPLTSPNPVVGKNKERASFQEAERASSFLSFELWAAASFLLAFAPSCSLTQNSGRRDHGQRAGTALRPTCHSLGAHTQPLLVPQGSAVATPSCLLARTATRASRP